jgi:hypothetical protein
LNSDPRWKETSEADSGNWSVAPFLKLRNATNHGNNHGEKNLGGCIKAFAIIFEMIANPDSLFVALAASPT